MRMAAMAQQQPVRKVMNVTVQRAEWKDADVDGVLAWRPLVEGLFNAMGATRWIYQLERGEDSGILHFQGCMKLLQAKRESAAQTAWKDVVRAKGVKLSDAPGVHVTAIVKYENGAAYCAKSETRVAGPWASHPEDIQEYTATAGKIKVDRALKQLMKARTRVWDLNWQPWQKITIKAVTTTKTHARNVVWVYDRVGGAGKSTLVDFLEDKLPKGSVVRLGWGSQRDLKYAVISHVEQHKGTPILVACFDLTRTAPTGNERDELYAVIEQIKNGAVVSEKYKSMVWTQAPAHVLVFANELPKDGALSDDRCSVLAVTQAERDAVKSVAPKYVLPTREEVKDFDPNSFDFTGAILSEAAAAAPAPAPAAAAAAAAAGPLPARAMAAAAAAGAQAVDPDAATQPLEDEEGWPIDPPMEQYWTHVWDEDDQACCCGDYSCVAWTVDD